MPQKFFKQFIFSITEADLKSHTPSYAVDRTNKLLSMKYRKLDSSVFADNSKCRFFSRLKDGPKNCFFIYNPDNS